MEKCNKCGSLHFHVADGTVPECHCKPFEIIDHNGEDETIYAFSDNDAALKYAKSSNEESDYYLMDDCVEILVNGKKFAIRAEPDIRYSANCIEE